MLGTFWVGDIVSIYQIEVIHLIKLITDDMSAWGYRVEHEARDLFAARAGLAHETEALDHPPLDSLRQAVSPAVSVHETVMEGTDVTDLVRAGSDWLCAPPQHRYVLMDIACLCGLGIDCLFVGIVCLCGSVASRSVAGMLWLSKTLWPHGTCCRTQPGGRFTTGSAPKRGGSSRAHGPDPPGGLRPACGLR